MRHKRQSISPWQWLVIAAIGLIGAAVLSAVFWQVFVAPAPPDFSGIFPSPTPPPPSETPTPAPTTPAPTPADTPTQLPAILETAATPLPSDTPTPAVAGLVVDNGIGLNMRAGPDSTQPIVARLLPLTPLIILGRTADSAWLLAATSTGTQGWVDKHFVTLTGSLDKVPLSTATVVAPTDATPSATPTAAGAADTPAPTSPAVAGDYPYILGISDTARRIFAAGQALGNRPNVFSKVGDSITANKDFLIPVGSGNYSLADYAYLQPVIDYFSSGTARTGNSFINTSLSADPGWSSWTAINFHAVHDPACNPGELPIACELRVVRPSVALILLGTNDVPDVDHVSANAYENQMRKIIDVCIHAGVIPVVSTLPPFHRGTGSRVQVFNDVLVKLTDEYDIPLWNYWAALQGLPNDGLGSDGVHPAVYPGSAADFSAVALQYGMNVRNLTALQALDAVWREVMR